MRLVKMYDDYNSGEVLKNFFKDKINWKLYNALRDICMNYEDKYEFKFDVKVEVKTLGRFGSYLYVMYDDKYNSGMIDGYAEEMIKDYAESGITYLLSLAHYTFKPVDGKDGQDIEREIFDKLSDRFKLELVHHLGIGLRFKEVG